MKESGELDTLKIVNIIFSEHSKLIVENPLLKEKVASLEELNQLYVKSDSLQKEEINICKEKIVSNEKKIQQLKSSRKNILTGSCVGGIVLFIIGLLL